MLPIDHTIRMKKTLLSLEGLSIGDSFGQCFFINEEQANMLIQQHTDPPPTWYFTDDTVMALSIVETLNNYGYINRDYLAKRFAYRYQQQTDRGYGGTAHKILRDISNGVHWKEASSNVFSGMGSMGNGAAMRAGPIGAYFFDDYHRAAKEALASAQVTHAHTDAQAGAIAVAIAAAYRASNKAVSPTQFLSTILEHTPQGNTHSRIARALRLPKDTRLSTAIKLLGNGLELCSFDTVPIALWFASYNLNNFSESIWSTVSALGDRDTTCAIAGSITSLSSNDAIPKKWISYREPLPNILLNT